MSNVLRKRAIARTLAETMANKNDDLRDLYVFGYQCKLFRDDERALFIDRGKHLIPWMGNDRLMIDRYDGRGHLHDLREFDSELVQAKALSEEEWHIEALCDEERYLELNSDFLEKNLYEEEELKRLNEALADDNSYSAVSFDYNSSDRTVDQSSTADSIKDDEETRPYVPIAALQLPPHITTPQTEKMHAIIERTAAFIAQHGVQMEIMMKAKQKDNAHFSFLNYEDELNAYYKHILYAIKHSKYTPASALQTTPADGAEEAYLHPNLSSSSDNRQQQQQQISRKEFLESISAKLPVGQIANTPYAKLLSNLSKHTRTHSPKPVEQPGDRSETAASDTSLPSVRSAPSLQQVASSSASRVMTANSSLPAVPGVQPVSQPLPLHTSSTEMSSSASENRTKINPASIALIPPPPPPEPSVPVPPPPDVRLIIDKMADYVARNGPEFEIVVRRRNDSRFRFVDINHPHHAYYLHKKDAFLQEMDSKKASEAAAQKATGEASQTQAQHSTETGVPRDSTETVQQPSTAAKTVLSVDDNKRDNKPLNRAVSFVIRTKEEEAPVLKKATALQYESTDDDDDDDGYDDNESSASSRQSSSIRPTSSAAVTGSVATSAITLSRSASNASVKSLVSTDATKLPPAVADSCQHAHKLSTVSHEKSSASREKPLTSGARNHRQLLQEQRKQKAAAFLTRMKQTDNITGAPTLEDATIAVEDASNPGSLVASPSMSPLSIVSVRSRSRSVTPSVAAFTSAAAATLDLPTDGAGLTSSRQPSPVLLVKRHKHKHRSRSPRRHRYRHRSRSRSHHRSTSKKHHKHKKKLPSAYAEIPLPTKASASRSPSRKSKLSHESRHKSSRHVGSSDAKFYSSLASSSKKRHLSPKDSKRLHHRLKKRHKTSKKSHPRHSSLSSSQTSSRSPSPVKCQRLSSENLIDLTLGDKPDNERRSDSDSVDQLSSPTSEHSKDKPSSGLSEVQALIEEKRRQLLKEDIVVLD